METVETVEIIVCDGLMFVACCGGRLFHDARAMYDCSAHNSIRWSHFAHVRRFHGAESQRRGSGRSADRALNWE